jgi:hypothetical protein
MFAETSKTTMITLGKEVALYFAGGLSRNSDDSANAL